MRVVLAIMALVLSAAFSFKAPTVSPAVENAATHAHGHDAVLPPSHSPIDFAHIIGADYKRHTGEPTGGHSLLRGDVRIIEGTESPPDASGVYRAEVQMADPQRAGEWITKTDRNGNPMPNTMFPKHWSAEQIVSEVEAAWFSPTKTIRGDKWSALTPSGVRVEGYLAPRVTAYPVYSKRR